MTIKKMICGLPFSFYVDFKVEMFLDVEIFLRNQIFLEQNSMKQNKIIDCFFI